MWSFWNFFKTSPIKCAEMCHLIHQNDRFPVTCDRLPDASLVSPKTVRGTPLTATPSFHVTAPPMLPPWRRAGRPAALLLHCDETMVQGHAAALCRVISGTRCRRRRFSVPPDLRDPGGSVGCGAARAQPGAVRMETGGACTLA